MKPEHPDLLIAPNLRLRRPVAGDQAACLDLFADPEVMAHCGGPLSADEARARFSDGLGSDSALWCIERRPGDKMIGVVENRSEQTPILLLQPECWGRGLATEALWLMLSELHDRVAENLTLPAGSPAARRVAERCGYASIEAGPDGLALRARPDRDQRLRALGDYYHAQDALIARQLRSSLGIGGDYADHHPLEPVTEAVHLVDAGPDCFDRPLYLTPETAEAWSAMRDAARRDSVALLAVSGFRDVHYQAGLIRRKLEKGQPLESILTVNVAPGYSEHHSGRALDLNTPDCEPLEEAFEQTEAFAWLMECAQGFGFTLSFPRDNPLGVAYEPWHWMRTGQD